MCIKWIIKFTVFFLVSCGWTNSYAQKQGQERIDSLLQVLPKTSEDTNKVKLLNDLSVTCRYINHLKGIAYGKQGLALAEKLNWSNGIAQTSKALGDNLMNDIDCSQAIKYYSRSLGIYEISGDQKNISAVLGNMGVFYVRQNNNQKGLEYYFRSLEISERISNKKSVSENLINIGRAYENQSNYYKAMEYYSKALSVYHELGDKIMVANCLNNIGAVYEDQSNYPKALQYYFEMLKVTEENGAKIWIANSLRNIGKIYKAQDNYSKALEYFLKELPVAEESGIKSHVIRNLNNIGDIYLLQDKYPEALNYQFKALKLATETGDKSNMAGEYLNICLIYYKLNDDAKAKEYESKGLNIIEKLDDKNDIVHTLMKIGNVYRDRGNYRKALLYYYQTLKITEELHWQEDNIITLGNIGAMYLTIEKDTAEPYIHSVRNIAGVVKKTGADTLIPKSKKACLNKAIQYLETGIMLGNKIGYIQELPKIATSLSEAQSLSGNYKGALESFKLAATIKDSLFSIENIKKIANLESKRETELKEKQIEVQRLQIVAAKNERKYYLAGLAAFVLLSVGMFGRFHSVRRNKKQLEDKNRVIAIEKENADRSRIRAERSEQFKQQFLANMSHEIRTPMNAVSGITDLLLQKSPRPDQLAYLQAISKSSDILLHVINDILDLSKIEAGKLELEKIEFSLPDTLKQVTDTLSYKAEEKGLQLIAHIDDNVPDVLIGDPYRLNQVLINLGGNAIKFTEKGGVQIDVKQVGEENGELALRFAVTDTGIGIPPDKLQKLFESFAQVNSSDTRKFGGTGLGLSISKQLVELQGGNISVESKESSGTTFSFVINYPIGSAEKLEQRIAAERKIDGSVLNGLRILVADDNEYNRLVVNETLHLKANVRIDLVTNGQEAIQMLEQNDYDVILMDVQMPVMNGIDATKYIRNKMEGPKSKIPIIALTASILRANLDMCTESGMNSYVPKPFKIWQLVHTIADVTGRKQNTVAVKKQETVVPATTTITNLNYLRDFCEGDEDRIKKYISLYLRAAAGFEEKVNAAMGTKDLDEVAALVHSFKPKWMMMGMKQTNEIGQKIEILCLEQVNEVKIKEALSLLLQQNRASIAEIEKTA